MTPSTYSNDAFTPREIAQKVKSLGVTKATTDGLTLFVLAILAGAFISLGGAFFAVVTTQSTLGFGLTRLIGGLVFCLGLVLVVIAGAELFTGNNLLAMAWASGLIGWRAVLRNWFIVYWGNVIGSFATLALILLGDTSQMSNGGVGETVINIARAKVGLTFLQVFARGILCNALVCLAVWLVLGGHSVTDKILAIIFPISAFVTIGFEHSIANWFVLPWGAILSPQAVPIAGIVNNLVAATLGNIVGGTLLVAGVYWLAYLRGTKHE
jgi:formate/nitrite transporter